LLREGYSPAFGARPLKRTVERLVLLPVAQKIAAGNVPAGSVLRLVIRNNQVDVEVDSPEAEEDRAGLARAVAQATPVAKRAAALVGQVAVLRDQAAPLAARKSELLAAAARPNFWDHRAAAQAVYDEIYRIDGILAGLDRLDKSARAEVDSAGQRQSDHDLGRQEERLEGLESQARHLAFLVTCRDVRDMGDALVILTLAAAHGAGLDAVARLAHMYVCLGRRRGLDVEVLGDRKGGDPAEDMIVLQMSGVGAYALLAHESGLHQVSRGRGEARDSRRRPVDRDVDGRLLARPRCDVQLLHLPTLISVRTWTEGTKAQAIERLRPLLRARVDASRTAADGGRPSVVRRYCLGPAPLVRDVRSGRSTGRLDQVFEGHLDLFLTPRGADGGAK
jgi:protein subunit release factor A